MPETAAPGSTEFGLGYVVLAAYQPDPTLFLRQVQSIQRQTVTNFRCIVSADGEPEAVAKLLSEVTSGDERFSVLGFEDRLGFYGNFERGLRAVPAEAAWVALADQDDRWDDDKLEKLLPHLATHAVVSCQARVIRYPGDEIISASTRRRDTPVASFTLDNQYTGSQMVFRRSVLDIALPLPRLNTPAQVHDHWIAIIGSFVGGSCVLPMIAQDYVQHGGNVIGEAKKGFNPAASVRNAKRIAKRYVGETSLRAMATVTYQVGVGWRDAMMRTLAERLPSAEVSALTDLYGPKRRFWHTIPFIFGAARRGEVSLRSAMEYTAGWVAGWIFRLRKR